MPWPPDRLGFRSTLNALVRLIHAPVENGAVERICPRAP